jgi:hypothetical protein
MVPEKQGEGKKLPEDSWNTPTAVSANITSQLKSISFTVADYRGFETGRHRFSTYGFLEVWSMQTRANTHHTNGPVLTPVHF